MQPEREIQSSYNQKSREQNILVTIWRESSSQEPQLQHKSPKTCYSFKDLLLTYISTSSTILYISPRNLDDILRFSEVKLESADWKHQESLT